MVNWGNALLVAVLGLGTVFAVLIIIMVVLVIMAKMLNTNKKEEKTENTQKTQNAQKTQPTQKKAMPASSNKEVLVEIREDAELIAVFAAAIAASLNTSTSNLRIKSYKRMGEAKSAWANAKATER